MKIQTLLGDENSKKYDFLNCDDFVKRLKTYDTISQEGILKLEIMRRLRPGIINLLNPYDVAIVEQYAQNIAHQTCSLCVYKYDMNSHTREIVLNHIRESINGLTLFLRENFNVTHVTVGLNDLLNKVINSSVRKTKDN